MKRRIARIIILPLWIISSPFIAVDWAFSVLEGRPFKRSDWMPW